MTRSVIDLVGPKGYEHNWVFVGAPGVGAHVFHPSLGHGTVTSHNGKSATVKFDKGGVSKSFEAKAGKAGEAAKLAPRANSDMVGVYDVQTGESKQVSRAEAAAGMARYSQSLGAGTPAAGVAMQRAMDVARGGGQLSETVGDVKTPAVPEWKRIMDEQAAKREVAGKSNARSIQTQMAKAQAQRVRVKETTGLTIPSPTGFRPGAGRSHVEDANNWLMHGRLPQAEDSLGSAQAEALRAGDKAAATKLAKFRSQVQRAHVKSAPPPLVKTGGQGNSSIKAIDHLGTRYTVSLSGGQVTVTGPGGKLSAPAGADPTRTARGLAAKVGKKGTVAAANPAGRAITLAVKTPPAQRAAGRRKLAAKGQALPGGEEPIPNVAYLKKAIRSVGRLDPSKRPALKALIRKRARELKATNAAGVKGTWAFQAANEGEALEMAATMARKMPIVRGPADVQMARTAPGMITVRHKSSGMKIGTMVPAGKGFQAMHADGTKTPASGSQQGALAALIGHHNKAARKIVPANRMGSATYTAGEQQALDFAGALPRSTP
jgi:hypothetical protein